MKYLILGLITLMISLFGYRILMIMNANHHSIIYKSEAIPKSYEITAKQLEDAGRSLYLVYCSSCHGADGKGNNGKAHDHTKRIAQKSILEAINNGSNNLKSTYHGGMPAGLVKDEDAKKIAVFLASGMQGEKPSAWATCASCHDESGKGIPLIAPNIHAYSDELIFAVLKNGKKGAIGTMPSFKGRFSDMQLKAIAAYIKSIGNANKKEGR